MPTPGTSRYASAAMTLHWTIALLIVIQLCLGWYMNEVLPDHSSAQAAVVTIHVSVGLTILLLVLVRIGIRLAMPPPPPPAGLQPWERALSASVHGMFYVLMLVLPLTGWALVSVHKGPIDFWGIPWPKLPGLGALAADKASRHTLQHVHVYWLIWIIVASWVLHVAGALKHQFDGHPVLYRMVPFLKRPA